MMVDQKLKLLRQTLKEKITSRFSDESISFLCAKDFGCALISFAFRATSSLRSESLGFASQAVCVQLKSFSNLFCPAVQQREICALRVTHGNLPACCRTDELQRVLSSYSKSINVFCFLFKCSLALVLTA
jgi:hypothetical protein